MVEELDGSNRKGTEKKKIQQLGPGLLRLLSKLIERMGKPFIKFWKKGAVRYRDMMKEGVNKKK